MNKFVIVKTKNNEYVLRYANVDFHKMMVHDGDECLGGGMFDFEDVDGKETMTLHGRSTDFGKPQFDKIKEKIHIDEDLEGVNIRYLTFTPDRKNNYEDLTNRFVFDLY